MIKDYFTVKEASAILDVSETTIYRLLNAGILPFLTNVIGNSKIVKIDDLQDVKPVQMTDSQFNKNVKKVLGLRNGI